MRSDGVLRSQIVCAGVEQRKNLAPAVFNKRVAPCPSLTAENARRYQVTLEVFIKSLTSGRAVKALDESVRK